MRFRRNRVDPEQVLDYDAAIMLDEEELAEGDIKRAYDEEVLPRLGTYLADPWPLTESADDDTPAYSVHAGGLTYPVYGPGVDENSWGLATFALFDIVNRQLADSPVLLYALNGGNDLFGILLTDEAVRSAAVLDRGDRPWLPTNQPPWYGAPGG